MSKFFADFAECPDFVRNPRLSAFVGVCPVPVYHSLSVKPNWRLSVIEIALLTTEGLIAAALNDGTNLWDDPFSFYNV